MILVVGSSNTDMIVKAATIPAPGETVLGGEFTVAAGGKGANQAVAASRCGGQVKFLAKLGTDSFGDQAIQNFRNDGIDVTHVLRDESHPSGVAIIMVSDAGENSIAVAPGANNRLSVEDIEAQMDAFEGVAIMLVQLEVPIDVVEKCVDIAASKGIRVILNPAPAQQLSPDLLAKVSILTPNETEASLLTGITVDCSDQALIAARKLLEMGVEQVVLTLGSDGAMIVDHKHHFLIPAPTVKAVDTTAAGDTFNGALAVALSEGNTIKEAVEFANNAAALSVTKLGAQPSVPTRSEVDAL